ncbi:MAG: squalene--hopene cyclase, partial [Planctomycetia bacterium]|nr:squalene--hopene cyclase [Planctomycetia bacterium]
LALQGAGATPDQGEHRDVVAKAWKTLLKAQQADGTFDTGPTLEQHQMYAHGQITIALCEAYGMTKDMRFEEPARRALEYAIAAQMPDGGWRYHPPRPGIENRGDMSVTGWYLMALKSGEMAGLSVPAATYDRLRGFLDDVFVSDIRGYGYRINPLQKVFGFRPALTAEALLCRQYLGWRRDDPRLASGVELLLREAPLDLDYEFKNAYAWYYQTQVCHHLGGAAWDTWNRWMQERLVPAQLTGSREKGSWDPANDKWGHVGGRLFVTSLCACMLEVYYRHLPLYREQ